MDKEYTEIVGANNKLLRAKRESPLSPLATKIELLIISNFRESDESNEFTLTKQDLLRCGASLKNYRRDIISAFDKLSNFKLMMDDGDGGIYRMGLTSSLHLTKNGSATFSYDSKVKPFLVFQKEQFCKFSFNVALGLTQSDYSAALYAYLETYLHSRKLGAQWTVELNIEDVRGRLCPGKYKAWGMFKQEVLIPAITEINADSNLHIKFQPKKEGRKYVKIKFSLRRQTWQPQLDFLGADPDSTIEIPQDIIDICEGTNGIGFIIKGKNTTLLESCIQCCTPDVVYNELIAIQKKYNVTFAPKMVVTDLNQLISQTIKNKNESQNLKKLPLDDTKKEKLLTIYRQKFKSECEEFSLLNSTESLIKNLSPDIQDFLKNDARYPPTPFIKKYIITQVEKKMGLPSEYLKKITLE